MCRVKSRMSTKTEQPVPAVILVRVSTAKQESDRQENELTAVAKLKGWTVIKVCREQISGRANASDRTGLSCVMELVRAGKVKKVMVHEVSRLSRRPSIIHAAAEEMEDHGVSLYWHSQSIETLLPSGKRNPAAAIMLALLGEMARSETDTLRERTRSGLAAAKARGVTLGRPVGYRKTYPDADKWRAAVADGNSLRSVAARFGVPLTTLRRAIT